MENLLIFVILFIRLLWGFIGYKMAKKRGRNVYLGFIGGLLFGLLCLFYYWIAGKSEQMVKAEKEEEYKRIAEILKTKKD